MVVLNRKDDSCVFLVIDLIEIEFFLLMQKLHNLQMTLPTRDVRSSFFQIFLIFRIKFLRVLLQHSFAFFEIPFIYGIQEHVFNVERITDFEPAALRPVIMTKRHIKLRIYVIEHPLDILTLELIGEF